MIRMLLVLAGFGIGTVAGLTHIIRAYGLLVWNDIFRPSEWAWNYGLVDRATFPSHKLTWAVFAIAAVIRPWQRRWNVAAVGIAGLLAWMWICRFASPFPAVAHEQAVVATKYLIPALIASLAMVDRPKQMLILYILAFSVGIWLVWAGVHATFIRGEAEIRMSIPGGQMTDRNDFLVGGTACLPLLAFIAWHYDGRGAHIVRPVMKIVTAICLLPFVMSLSRGALVGLFGLGLFYSAFTGKFFRRFLLACSIGLALVLVAPESTWERMETIELGAEQSESSARNRIEHMTTAVTVTLDRPVFGAGPDGFAYESQKYGDFLAEPHSIWLKCSAEYGLVGIVLFLVLLIVLGRKLLRIARRARREGDKRTEALATALCCSFVGFLSTGTFTSQFLGEYLWAILGLAGAFTASEEAALREQLAPAPDARSATSASSEPVAAPSPTS